MKLAIGGPTRDTVPALFALNFAELYAYTREHGPWATVLAGFKVATYIHIGREEWLQDVIGQDATHALWIDSDMSVPPYAAVQLAQHEQAVVAANYLMRDDTGRFTAQRGTERVHTTPHSTGLEAVDGCGMGLMLLRCDALRGLSRPWFQHGRNQHGGDVGEDLMFCNALRDAGHEIYIDHDLSKEVGHVGQHVYRIPAPPAAVAV